LHILVVVRVSQRISKVVLVLIDVQLIYHLTKTFMRRLFSVSVEVHDVTGDLSVSLRQQSRSAMTKEGVIVVKTKYLI
jgi:hypothetical protein